MLPPAPEMDQCWYHGNITRSRAEDLLSKVGKDGSFLVRASESIASAYALCVLYRNCVYTYRILPDKENKLIVQASEGVPVRYFQNLEELIEYYKKENMGLVWHLKYPVPREEEEAADELEEDTDLVPAPPVLPPRNILTAAPSCETKEASSLPENSRVADVNKLSLSETLLQRLQHQDTSSVSDEHLKLIQDYLRVHIISDFEIVQTGSSNLPQLKKLLTALCKGLFSEASRTLPSLESIQKVFEQQLHPGTHQRSQVRGGRWEEQDRCVGGCQQGQGWLWWATMVKTDSLGIFSKIQLKVDVEMGKLIIKRSKDGPEDKFYTHKKILQLIKSQKLPNKLVIVLETEKEKTQRKEYVFSDSKKREGFCQLLQQMKNKHSEQPEPDMITIFIGTWNMGMAPPPKKITSWFLSKGQGRTRDDTADYIPHDIYVIGTQEDPQGEKEWLETLRQSLQEITSISFKVVRAIHTLWNIRIVVLAKPEHENRISHICTANVKTGIANTLGNKGAVGVSFMFNGTSFGFVNSHLTSGSEKKHRRNQNYMNILRFLTLGDKKLSPFNITHRFTHLFWLGDLNYRVEQPPMEAENIIQKIRQQQYPELLAFDQLLLERRDQKVFLQFEEEEITFAPTYRFERGTREKYAYTKQKATGMKYNLPSWCDRVLWKSYPMVHVVCQSYGCTTDIMTSDHSPVFATFEVGVTSQFVSKNDSKYTDSQGEIEFLHCYATLKTKSQTKFYIEFHSSCLESFVKSQEGENEDGNEGELVVKFVEALPKLTPIISDPEYLLDQHILISIKSSDSDESYGEGCIALRMEATESLAPIHTVLTHHGEKTGIFQGEIKLQTPQGKQREKLYGKERHHLCNAHARECSPQKISDNYISNPNYLGIAAFSQQPSATCQPKQTPSSEQTSSLWNYEQQSKENTSLMGQSQSSSTSPSLSPLSPKPSLQPTANRISFSPYDCRPPDMGKSTAEPVLQEEGQQRPEMFENPLYGSMASKGKVAPRKEQEYPKALRKEQPPLPEQSCHLTKPPEPECGKTSGKQPSPPFLVPTQLFRSYTSPCQLEEKNTGEKSQGKPKMTTPLENTAPLKKLVKPSRAEVNLSMQGQQNKPPLPSKSRAVLDMQNSKGRDYRDSSELPHSGKHRMEEGSVTLQEFLPSAGLQEECK
uniref:phosphatidylinositol-3,4,5-trisphosphate 5-phosphatase n=1 Tax=Cyanoderma ruficeps TaxID=181631 RepID=A0A8C3XF17_9PASS